MVKITAAVGAGSKAVNDPKDIVLVQKLLNSHAKIVGYKPLRLNGEIDQPTVLAIGQFQQQVVKTKVTTLIKPGSKTFKMLIMKPKKIAELLGKGGKSAKSPKPLKGKVYEVKWKGTTHFFTEDDMQHCVLAISSRLDVEVMRFMATLRNYQDRYRDMKKLGLTSFFVMLVTPNADIVAPEKSLKKASAAIDKLVDLAYSKNRKNLMAAFKQMTKAKIALDAAAFDLNNLSKELGQSAGVCVEIAVDVRDGSADIVQLILVTNGINPATAGAIVAASKNVVQEIANGAILKGQWVKEGGVVGSIKRISFATVSGGFAGWVGGKVGKIVMGAVGDKLATRMITNRYISRYLWRTARRWGGKEIGAMITRFPELSSQLGGEIALLTIVRMAHKFVTGPKIAKALTKQLNNLEKTITSAMDRSSTQSQLIDNISSALDEDGIAGEILEEILNSKKKEILREIEKDLKKAT